MTAVKSLLFNLVIAVSTVVAGIILLPALLISRKAGRRITLTWCHWLFWVLRHVVGLTVDIRGLEHIASGPAIYAAKHQSAMETFQLPLVLPQADIVLKRELVMIPIFGWFMASLGTVPINRQAGARALKTMLASARATVALGRSIMIFPEGTRTSPGARLPYHPGIAALYTNLGLPVVPIAVNTGLYWGRRSFSKRPGIAVIEFLPAIPPGMDRRDFMATLEDHIETASAQLLPQKRENRG